jgi:hypothetical protein
VPCLALHMAEMGLRQGAVDRAVERRTRNAVGLPLTMFIRAYKDDWPKMGDVRAVLPLPAGG